MFKPASCADPWGEYVSSAEAKVPGAFGPTGSAGEETLGPLCEDGGERRGAVLVVILFGCALRGAFRVSPDRNLRLGWRGALRRCTGEFVAEADFRGLMLWG